MQKHSDTSPLDIRMVFVEVRMRLRIQRSVASGSKDVPVFTAALRLEMNSQEAALVNKFGLAPLVAVLDDDPHVIIPSLLHPQGFIIHSYHVQTLIELCDSAIAALQSLPAYWQRAAEWSGEQVATPSHTWAKEDLSGLSTHISTLN